VIDVVSGPGGDEAGRLVLAAFLRSVGGNGARLGGGDAALRVLVDGGAEEGELEAWMAAGARKLIVFGKVPPRLVQLLGLRPVEQIDGTDARSDPAPAHQWRASKAEIGYSDRAGLLGGKPWRRAFERFDFADEWNNLGFGAIRAEGSIWALATALQAPMGDEIAAIAVGGAPTGVSYAALFDRSGLSVLWFNRSVGPIDSFEWRLVENFLSGYRADELPSAPVLREIAWGYDAAVTMRLDADEDIATAKPLMDRYRAIGVPFSLAVLTSQLDRPDNRDLVTQLLVEGGAVLSHSMTHASRWGGSLEAALTEAKGSADALEAVTGRRPAYAVSPFHETPPFALQALEQSGYHGCIGGSIRTDPEFQLARGGAVAGIGDSFVGHSQQCMVHGDCLLEGADPLAVYKQAFDLAYESASLFGYLDHPFSPRYQYGWASEAGRIAAHEALIAYIRARAERPLFMSEETALDFLRWKGEARVQVSDSGAKVVTTGAGPGGLGLAVEYRGETFPARTG